MKKLLLVTSWAAIKLSYFISSSQNPKILYQCVGHHKFDHNTLSWQTHRSTMAIASL